MIAFYLPQFYHTAENDGWWGKGFTEWRSATNAVPLFKGHMQPHLPLDLGFYNQTHVDTLRQQAKLAKTHAIDGFCHYYYWFDGRRLLNKPTELLLDNPDIDLPYCLCWANEHWTRRWDGQDEDILMPQTYEQEFYEAFAHDLAPYFADKRYICVERKPVFVIYKAQEIPSLEKLCTAIHAQARASGHDGAYILGAETFMEYGKYPDPRDKGLDGAVEFPPHAMNLKEYTMLPNMGAPFEGHVFSANQTLLGAIMRKTPGYPLHRTVFPGWDNTARRHLKASIFAGTSPDWFAEWLTLMRDWTLLNHPGSKQILFINAWNEWAEGAHLEPDLIHGQSHLQKVKAISLGNYTSRLGVKMEEVAIQNGKSRHVFAAKLTKEMDALFDPKRVTLETIQKLDNFGRVYDTRFRKFPFHISFKYKFLLALLGVRSMIDLRRVIGTALRVDVPTKPSHRWRNTLFRLIHEARRRGVDNFK